MVMTIARDGALVESAERHLIPKERYVSRDFFDLEMERLWPRVWQMACREEEVPRTGDYLEYVIGEETILVTRSDPDTIRAFYNTCPHRGTRLAVVWGTSRPTRSAAGTTPGDLSSTEQTRRSSTASTSHRP